MKTEQVQQIIEAIQTWNVNIDSETSVQVVHELIPILKLFIIKEFVGEIIPILIMGILFILTSFTIIKVAKIMSDTNLKALALENRNKD